MRVIQIVVAIFAILIAGLMALLYRTERLVLAAGTRLAAIPCPRCGVVTGVEAATAAETARVARLRKLHEHAGGGVLRSRIDPYWRFPCAACGAALIFDPGTTRMPLTLAEGSPQLDSTHDAPM